MMIIYTDIVSGDELFSDACKVKDVNSILYEIDCEMIKIKEGADVDIGANASKEEAEETLEDGEKIVNDVVHAHRLQPTSFDKKGFTVHFKTYMKALKAKHTTEGKAFDEAGIAASFKEILGKFKDYEFYTGESMNVDGAIMLLNYRDDGTTPFFTVFKAGLKETKVGSRVVAIGASYKFVFQHVKGLRR
ncbi:hypothetical protein BGZ65_008817, partial [Modicella reniformis]